MKKIKFLLGRPHRMLLVIEPPLQKAERPCLTQTPFLRSHVHVTLLGSG